MKLRYFDQFNLYIVRVDLSTKHKKKIQLLMKTIVAVALLVRHSVLAQGRMLVSLLPVTGASQTIDELMSIRPEYDFFKKEYLRKNKILTRTGKRPACAPL